MKPVLTTPLSLHYELTESPQILFQHSEKDEKIEILIEKVGIKDFEDFFEAPITLNTAEGTPKHLLQNQHCNSCGGIMSTNAHSCIDGSAMLKIYGSHHNFQLHEQTEIADYALSLCTPHARIVYKKTRGYKGMSFLLAPHPVQVTLLDKNVSNELTQLLTKLFQIWLPEQYKEKLLLLKTYFHTALMSIDLQIKGVLLVNIFELLLLEEHQNKRKKKFKSSFQKILRWNTFTKPKPFCENSFYDDFYKKRNTVLHGKKGSEANFTTGDIEILIEAARWIQKEFICQPERFEQFYTTPTPPASSVSLLIQQAKACWQKLWQFQAQTLKFQRLIFIDHR